MLVPRRVAAFLTALPQAIDDFKTRISKYEEVYTPMENRDMHYIKLIDMCVQHSGSWGLKCSAGSSGARSGVEGNLMGTAAQGSVMCKVCIP